MFQSSKSGHNNATVIAHGVKVEGDFSSGGDVLIEGEVQGTLVLSGKLTVGSHANIQASVTAGSAEIFGAVKGDITVAEKIEIHAEAAMDGDISAAVISVEAGAQLAGRVLIGEKVKATTEGRSTKKEKAQSALVEA